MFPELDPIDLLSEPGLLWDIDANCSPLGPGSLQHLAIAKFIISPCQWTPPSPEGKARPSLAKVALIEVNPPTRVPSMDLSLPSPGIFMGFLSTDPRASYLAQCNATPLHISLASDYSGPLQVGAIQYQDVKMASKVFEENLSSPEPVFIAPQEISLAMPLSPSV